MALAVLSGLLFTTTGSFLCGEANKNNAKTIKLVFDVKGVQKFKGSVFEVEYTIGHGRNNFDRIIVKDKESLKLKKPTLVKEIPIFDEEQIDYSQPFLVEFSVTLFNTEGQRIEACSTGNWSLLKTSQKLEKVVINILYNESDFLYKCFQSFKYAKEKTK